MGMRLHVCIAGGFANVIEYRLTAVDPARQILGHAVFISLHAALLLKVRSFSDTRPPFLFLFFNQ